MDQSSISFMAAPSPYADIERPSTATGGLFLDTDHPSRIFPAGEPPSMMGGSIMGGSMLGGSMMSSTDSRMRRKGAGLGFSKVSKDGRCSSAPLLQNSKQSTHATTWYTASTMTGSSGNGRSLWKPLAGSWRDWDSDEFGAPVRRNVDEGGAFVDGCIPHWGKCSSMRKNGALEHELAFAYYRLRRHHMHPHRKQVGDPTLPPENVVAEMRSGKDKQFYFWRDLRPPFKVIEVRKLPGAPTEQHPDGEVHEVEWECAIDYHGEHLWNLKSDNATFDNKVRSTALVRIPHGYPCQRPSQIVNWGTPKLNWGASDHMDDDGNPLRPVLIDPGRWNAMAHELKERADHPRFAKLREGIKKADSKKLAQTKSLQKLAAAPNSSSLAKLAKEAEQSGLPQKMVKPRQHRIFTPAAGFVRYAG